MQSISNKPRVFVSSTIHDFSDLRSALRYWLEQMGLDVLMSEYNDFDRRPEENTFESCFNAIKTCDYYVLLVGGRQGSKYKDETSVTQQEYRVAIPLAKEGNIKPVVFIRDEVLNVLSERKSLQETENGIDPYISTASSVLINPDFVRSFVDEIRQTELGHTRNDGPSGNIWYYRFTCFADLVDALRINFRLYFPVHRQALLANLKWEIEDNIATLCTNHKGVPSQVNRWIVGVRNRLQLSGRVLDHPFRLNYKDALHISIFWDLLPEADSIKSFALRDAISSGEFLQYSQETCCLAGSDLYKAMQLLLSAIEKYSGLRTMLLNTMYDNRKVQLTGEVKVKSGNYLVYGYELVFLFGAHDRIEDIFRLSATVAKYAIDPSSTFTLPALCPMTPIVDQQEQLEAERATREIAEQWIKDGQLWGWTAAESLKPEGYLGTLNGYPVLKRMLDSKAERLAGLISANKSEFDHRTKTEGQEAAFAWVNSLRERR